MSSQLYDRIGRGYVSRRRADPRIAAAVHAALGDARSVLNVGAGAGAYEPRDRRVLAVEPAAQMRAQRPPGAAACLDATAEDLPVPDASFDAVLAIYTDFHWADVRRGITEMVRVSRDRLVLLTDDGAVRSPPAGHRPGRPRQSGVRSRQRRLAPAQPLPARARQP